jgi:uncharacterized membrane-anchored protein
MSDAQAVPTVARSDADAAVTTHKLPRVDATFWIIKIAAVTLGETAGDELSQTLGLGYLPSFFLFILLFLVAVTFQLRAEKFHPALYWTVIIGTSTAGTTLSDFLDRSAHLGYIGGSAILMTLLALVFVVWSRTGETFNVQKIQTVRGECLYWTAILLSNTLGTATGDFLSTDSGLGFWGAGLLIAAVMLAILAAYYWTNISKTLLFWAAFVLTRPLGANAGDLFWKPHAKGGLGYGSLNVSIALIAIIAAFTTFSIWHNRRAPEPS